MEDEWDWDRDEILDLDITGDPQLDQFGYQSPRRDFTPPPSRSFDYLAQYRRDQAKRERRRRAAVEQNLAEMRRRNAERRGQPSHQIVEWLPEMQYQPGMGPQQPGEGVTPGRPDLAPHVAQAVAQGMPGRDLGWWRVDVDAYGRATWTRVEQPGPDGPRMTVEQVRTQGSAPVELHQPSDGTQVW